MSNDVLLCTNPRMTVGCLKDAVARADRALIADFIKGRFLERYFDPIDALDAASKNGFGIMALSCLTVEALQCFHEGLPTSDGKSKAIFQRFFEQTDEFREFRPYWLEFYKGVRCGILHQSETTLGWRIRRSGPLLDAGTRKINATRFHMVLKEVLRGYINELNSKEFHSELWLNCRKKLDAIIANCEP